MLKSFINAVNRNKGRPEIAELQIANPFNLKTHFTDKESTVDVKARTVDGSFYDIEVQLLDKGNFAERSLYYWARIFCSQLQDSNKYNLLKPVICINVINFKLLASHETLHSSYRLLENDKHDLLSSHLILDFLELPRLTENCKMDGELQEWLSFFASDEGKAMLEYNSPEVQNAVKPYHNFMADPELREAYEAHLKASLDYNSAMDFSYRNGRQAGIEEGMEKGRLAGALENARKMVAKGLAIELVSECTGLSLDEVKALI